MKQLGLLKFILKSKSSVFIYYFIFLLMNCPTLAQRGYSEGYVVLEKGDTVHGMLKQFSPEMSCLKVSMIDENGKKVKVKKGSLIAYRRGYSLYVKKNFQRPFVLGAKIGYMKMICRGEVNLYKFYYKVEGSNPNTRTTGSYTEQKKSDYYIERAGDFDLVRRNGFDNRMADYFKEYEALSQKIKNQEFEYYDISAIVDEFNEWSKNKLDVL